MESGAVTEGNGEQGWYNQGGFVGYEGTETAEGGLA